MAENNLHSIAFPTLDEAQIKELARCTSAAPKLYRDGETLFAVGDRDFKFFIVTSGEVEIVDHSGKDGVDCSVLNHGSERPHEVRVLAEVSEPEHVLADVNLDPTFSSNRGQLTA